MEVLKAATDQDHIYTLSDFESAVKKIDEIETMPVVAKQLLAITANPDFNMNELHDLVQGDPAIAAKILRVASSPVYGSRPATNLRAALVRVGLRDLSKIVMTSAMTGGKITKFTEVLWTYSLKVACVSEVIAGLVPTKDLDDPFLCGLLHDFGTVLMNKVIGKPYRKALGTPCQADQSAIEYEQFGFDHCDLGVMVAQEWALFEALEHVMQHHHSPLHVNEVGISESSQAAVFVVALAREAVMGFPEESADMVSELCERLTLSDQELITCEAKGLAKFRDLYASLVTKAR